MRRGTAPGCAEQQPEYVLSSNEGDCRAKWFAAVPLIDKGGRGVVYW